MKISAKIEYACRALIQLSLHWPSEVPIQIHTIAQMQEIPIKFLTHILINLKQLGFVESVRGKSGGYILTRDPKNIMLSDVVRHFGGLGLTGAQAGNEAEKKGHVMNAIWQEVDALILEKLETFNFEIISGRFRKKHEALNFEI